MYHTTLEWFISDSVDIDDSSTDAHCRHFIGWQYDIHSKINSGRD